MCVCVCVCVCSRSCHGHGLRRAFGPKACGPNILVSHIGNGAIPNEHPWLGNTHSPFTEDGLPAGTGAVVAKLANSIRQGFQLATASGPLCGEPMWGIAFVVDALEFDPALVADMPAPSAADGGAGDDDGSEHDGASSVAGSVGGSIAGSIGGNASGGTGAIVTRSFGPLKGQVMSAVKEGCRQAFEAGSPRLVEAMFKCQLQCATSGAAGGAVLGKMYGVIRRRRGRVVQERLVEGTQLFIIDTLLPVRRYGVRVL